MLLTALVVMAMIGGTLLWGISIQRKLVVLAEYINNAMSQIGVQLSSRFDALTALLYLMKNYASDESETLLVAVKASRAVITTKSLPADVLQQERVITEMLEKISIVTAQYPELKVNEAFIEMMDAIQAYESMIRTSRLIYNESVNTFNREIRLFPVVIVARILGFAQRDYLTEPYLQQR